MRSGPTPTKLTRSVGRARTSFPVTDKDFKLSKPTKANALPQTAHDKMMKDIFQERQKFYAAGTSLLNSGNFNPDLHPRDELGEFEYNGGRKPRHHAHAKKPKGGSGESAIHNAITKLKIDKTYNVKTGKPGRHGIYLTHYGPGTLVGGWDDYNDTNTNKGLGKKNIKLNAFSLAISDDIAKASSLKLGGPVYVNGEYIGNYDDKPGEKGRIDIYDPNNRAGKRWAGMVWVAVVTNHP